MNHFSFLTCSTNEKPAKNKVSLTSSLLIEDGISYDYVFYLNTHEPPVGINDEAVKIEPALALGKKCAEIGVKTLFTISTGDVYEYKNTTKSEETSAIKPRNKRASICAKIDEGLSKISGLNLVILRVPMVYGPNSTGDFMKYMAIAYIHSYKRKKMKLLGSSSDKKNTVHSLDVARAAWAATVIKVHGGSRETPVFGTEIYNIVDENDTDQGALCSLCEAVFDVSTGFQESAISSLASFNLRATSEYINNEVKTTWADLCKKARTYETPLTPFVNKNFLTSGCNITASKLFKTFNFSIVYPNPTPDLIKDIIASHISSRVWPAL